MATNKPVETNNKLEELETLDAMLSKSKQYPKKLIAVLFNVQFPSRGTIEPKLLWWRHNYEKENNVLFFKRVCYRGDKDLKEHFKITTTPAFVFFHNGKELTNLVNLNETKSNYHDAAKLGEDSADEKLIKEKIKTLCSSLPVNTPNSNG